MLWIIGLSIIFQTELKLHAGPLEDLSQLANPIWNKSTCSQKFSVEGANQAIKEAQNYCPQPTQTAFPRQLGNAQATFRRDEDLAEDSYFGLLATQHALELRCSSAFAAQIANDNEQAVEDLEDKIRALRITKQGLLSAARRINLDPEITTKVCPLTMDDLSPNALPNGQRDQSFEACRDLIVNRQAHQAILASIPLSATPSIAKFLQTYSNLNVNLNKNPQQEAELINIESNLKSAIRQAYRNGNLELKSEAQRIENIVSEKGGAGFDRTERHGLLSDDLVNHKVLLHAGNGTDIQGLACRADARYGKGADALNLTVTVGSFALGGATTVVAKIGTAAARGLQVANAARGSGLLSLNATRALQVAAMSATGLSSYLMVDRACVLSSEGLPHFKNRPGTLKIQATDFANNCVSAPKVENLGQDSCVLRQVLSAIGMGWQTLDSAKELIRVRNILRDAKILRTQPPAPAKINSPAAPPNASDGVAHTQYKSIKMNEKHIGEEKGLAEFNGKTWTVKYFSPAEREATRVFIKDGLIVDKLGKPLNIRNGMYVMDARGNFYITEEVISKIHHSSFFAGGNVAGAGKINVNYGVVTYLDRSSGHYLPTAEVLKQTVLSLRNQGANLDKARVYGLIDH